MKSFFFDLFNKFNRTSQFLDAKTELCNKTWRVFTDSDEKEVHVFLEDGTLVISIDGNVTMGKWIYVPANHSIVISGNNQHLLVHPIMCNNILALVQDGTDICCFLLDDTKAELEKIKTLQNIKDYIIINENKGQHNLNNQTLSLSNEFDGYDPGNKSIESSKNTSCLFDDTASCFEPSSEIRANDPNLLFRWSNHTFYYKYGIKYIRLKGGIFEKEGNKKAILNVSESHDFDRMILWLRDDDAGSVNAILSLRCSNMACLPQGNSYMDNWGNRITKESFERIYSPQYESVIKRVLAYKVYEN